MRMARKSEDYKIIMTILMETTTTLRMIRTTMPILVNTLAMSAFIHIITMLINAQLAHLFMMLLQDCYMIQSTVPLITIIMEITTMATMETSIMGIMEATMIATSIISQIFLALRMQGQ